MMDRFINTTFKNKNMVKEAVIGLIPVYFFLFFFYFFIGSGSYLHSNLIISNSSNKVKLMTLCRYKVIFVYP